MSSRRQTPRGCGRDGDADPVGRSNDNCWFTFEHHSPADIACGAMPELVLSYYTAARSRRRGKWLKAGPMNAWAIRREEPRRIGIGAGIALIWRNYRYGREPKVIDAR
jgi:hypothetical protein